MVDSDSAIMFESLTEIIPECELITLPRMQGAKGIHVTETEVSPIPLSRLRLKQRIVDPRCRFVQSMSSGMTLKSPPTTVGASLWSQRANCLPKRSIHASLCGGSVLLRTVGNDGNAISD